MKNLRDETKTTLCRYFLRFQASASALEDVVKVEDSPSELTVILVTSGIYAVLYFLVIPVIS